MYKFYFFDDHINVDNLIKVYIFLIRIKTENFLDNTKIKFLDRKTVDLPLVVVWVFVRVFVKTIDPFWDRLKHFALP